MLIGLTITILIPAMIGMGARMYNRRVAAFCAKYKEPLTFSAHIALATIPFMKIGVSHAHILAIPNDDLVLVVVVASALHLFLLAVLFVVTAPFPGGIPLPLQKAIVSIGSGKTLPVSMAVLA